MIRISISSGTPVILAAGSAMAIALACATLTAATPPSAADASLFPPSWRPVDRDAARQQLQEWLATVQHDGESIDAALADEVLANWNAALQEDPAYERSLLDRVADALALVDSRAAALIEQCRHPTELPAIGPPPTGAPAYPTTDWLSDATVSSYVRSNLRLLVARRLVQEGFYDECLAQLEGIQTSDVVEPATLLFCRMAAHHQLVEPEEARLTLARLLEQEASLPRRYQQLARLVERDLASLQDDSLDHIARRMQDIRRRLRQGSAGERVLQIEDGVVRSLDEFIKQQEEMQKQQQGAQSASGGAQSARPMEESRPAELKAPGKVDPRDIGSQSGWGDLAPRDREQAMEQVGREFPAHYRELIEQYFRELAAEESGLQNRER